MNPRERYPSAPPPAAPIASDQQHRPLVYVSGAWEIDCARRAVAMLIDAATSANGPFWTLAGRCLEGKLLIKQGKFEAGATLLRSQLATAQETGWAIWYPEFLGVLAEGLV